MKMSVVVAIAVLASLLTYAVFGKTETVVETVYLPSTTDTLYVDVEHIRTVYDTVFPPVQSDILIIPDTIWLTRPDTITALPPRWRLTALTAGQAVTEPTVVASDLLTFDGHLTLTQSLENYPATLGPITDIRSSADGITISFGSWPEPDKTCGFGCIAKWTLGGVAAGVILGGVL